MLALSADAEDFFETRVRPVLAKNCFTCHNTNTRMGGLEMKSRQALLKGGASGPAIVPGQPEQSLLIQAVRHTHARLKMPFGQEKLKEPDIADLASWVKMGATWPAVPNPLATPNHGEYVITPEQRAFWSFQPIGKVSTPEVRNRAWPRSAIDFFILSELETRGLRPVKAADKRQLIRRATLDLVGIPPSPEEVDVFLRDYSQDAFAKVIDRLLASPHYGERWGRHWLDVARYSDEQLGVTTDVPLPNAFRYRDWVIQAFNDDMPYDQFVKAQIAGDLLGGQTEKFVAGLGFYSLGPPTKSQDDRVDATTRGFLGLTVACAKCHDHKYDPIPTEDYYSLLGVFESTEGNKVPLVPESTVERYKQQKKEIDEQEAALKKFIQNQRTQLIGILGARASTYIVAAWKILGPARDRLSAVVQRHSLDQELLERWIEYLSNSPKQYPYLDWWEGLLVAGSTEEEVRRLADKFQDLAISLIRQKESIDEKNAVILAQAKKNNDKSPKVLSLTRDRFFLFRDLTGAPRPDRKPKFAGGLFYYEDENIDRFLHGVWKEHLDAMRDRLASLKAALPPEYPYLPTIKDKEEPSNLHIYIGGDKENLGEEAPRRFLAILSKGEPVLFARGSGRLELAEAIASPKNPLTARVMVNRIWQHHFGEGIVRTPSNLGQLGERPTHPELLDYLASRFIENNWSIKSMHREIMLSATYALSTDYSPENHKIDPDNRLLWRHSRRRLDVEALRDSLLSVSGNLDAAIGGSAAPLTGQRNNRRTVYGSVSRRKLDPLLELFDFPNPIATSEKRIVTNVPLQKLFFLNSDFIFQQAEALARRLQGEFDDDEARIERAYRLLFSRHPTREEVRLGREFLQEANPNPWLLYSQVLLSANEFQFIN